MVLGLAAFHGASRAARRAHPRSGHPSDSNMLGPKDHTRFARQVRAVARFALLGVACTAIASTGSAEPSAEGVLRAP